jgi:hypothetical protein
LEVVGVELHAEKTNETIAKIAIARNLKLLLRTVAFTPLK